MKLVLSGGGGHNDTKKIDTMYKGLLSGKNILYIPRAMYPEKYESCQKWIQNIFPIEEGYSVYTLSEKDFLESKQEYTTYDGMYIGGGNTYRLLKLIKDTGFSKVIEQFLANDKPIYGGSAGAIIMGENIHTSKDRNAVKLLDDESLGYNVCKNYAIVCHYISSNGSDDEIKDYVKYYQIPVVCLPEETGVIYNNDIYSIQGEKSAYLFTVSGEKIELKIGETFNLI